MLLTLPFKIGFYPTTVPPSMVNATKKCCVDISPPHGQYNKEMLRCHIAPLMGNATKKYCVDMPWPLEKKFTV